MVVDNKSKHRLQYLIPKRTSSTLQGGKYQLQLKAAVITIKPINTQALLKEKPPIFDSPDHSAVAALASQSVPLSTWAASLQWQLEN